MIASDFVHGEPAVANLVMGMVQISRVTAA
jgi:hypothetical protein